MSLVSKKCAVCEMGGSPLAKSEVDKFLIEINDWQVSEDYKKISRRWKFKDFKEALNFVNRVGDLAEGEGHHPDIALGWGYVKIDLTTHAVKGLSENDFILAAKIDRLE